MVFENTMEMATKNFACNHSRQIQQKLKAYKMDPCNEIILRRSRFEGFDEDDLWLFVRTNFGNFFRGLFAIDVSDSRASNLRLVDRVPDLVHEHIGNEPQIWNSQAARMVLNLTVLIND